MIWQRIRTSIHSGSIILIGDKVGGDTVLTWSKSKIILHGEIKIVIHIGSGDFQYATYKQKSGKVVKNNDLIVHAMNVAENIDGDIKYIANSINVLLRTHEMYPHDPTWRLN